MSDEQAGIPFERVGGYELVRRIGVGGMGEVFLARDPRLERAVAVKLLPPELSRDPEALARLRQEALTLASLNHPNIATIHGFESAPDGGLALILEHVEGESLASRLERGPLPVTEALTVCAQVAEALEVAHERGIVHRDLKPGNVMLAPRGLVKVLDFGLAQRTRGLVGLWGTGPAEAAVAITPREDEPRRDSPEGAWVGTPGYASPEQLIGGEQDQRGDVFAFGALLYECLAGRRAFEGRDEWEVMARVLNEAPDPAALPRRLSPRVRALLDRCLDKTKETRLDSLRAARIEIEDVLGVRRAAALRAGEGAAIANNLPRQLTSFVGRQVELERCRAELGHTRMLTLLGMGGSGKTRLAIELAAGVLDDHPDGVWFADLGVLRDSQRVIEAVALAAGAREEPDKPPEAALSDHIGERRMLIVMDNCEDVLPACRDLASRLLTRCGSLDIIATSREPLGVAGESIHVVPPLGVPSGAEGEDPTEAEAVRLFIARAEAARADFALSAGQASVVAEICRRLDGIPLALELAAARVRVLGIEQILARLGDRFRLLTASRTDGDRRHQTLRAVIQWSTDQLGPGELESFRSFSVFVGSWSLESAVAVSGRSSDEFEVLDILQRLAEKSLVVLVRAPTGDARYRYLESVRQLATELLDAAGETSAVRDRHLEHFLGVAERIESRIAGSGQKDALLELDLEHADVLAAHAWCATRSGRGEMGLRIAAGMHRYWSVRGQYRLGGRTLKEALLCAGEAVGGRAWATASVRAAAFALYENDHQAARPLLEQSLAVYRSIGDKAGVARALHGLGTVALFQRDYVTARTWIMEVVGLHREKGDPRAIASALHNLGEVDIGLGDLTAARAHYEESLTLLEKVGDELRLAAALEGLAVVHTRRGDLDTARTAIRTGLRMAASLGAHRETAYGLEVAAEAATASGEPVRALYLLGAAGTLRERNGPAMLTAEREQQDRLIAGMRVQIGEAATIAAMQDGRSTALPKVVASVLEWLKPPGTDEAAAGRTSGDESEAPG